MNVVLRSQIAGSRLAPSMMFCFPTASTNIWSPKIEQVMLPGEQGAPLSVEVKICSEIASSRQYKSWKRKAYEAAIGLLHEQEPLDYSGKFVFDARFDTYKNIAHILDNVATRVFFAKHVLQEHFQKEIQIQVILDCRATQHGFAMEVYRLLGLPVIATDRDVYRDVITVSEHEIFSAKQSLFNFEFPGDRKPAFEKIFIPRRGNRSLINNDEVAEFLTKQGFQTCYFEDYTIAEQWSMARNAKVIVAVHGAAVSSVIFNRLGVGGMARSGSGVKVVELFSPAWIHSGFRDSVNAVNGRWCAVRGQITPQILQATDFSQQVPDSLKSPYKDPFKVDCQTIQMALDYVGAIERRATALCQ
jgi:hypothetical protein